MIMRHGRTGSSMFKALLVKLTTAVTQRAAGRGALPYAVLEEYTVTILRRMVTSFQLLVCTTHFRVSNNHQDLASPAQNHQSSCRRYCGTFKSTYCTFPIEVQVLWMMRLLFNNDHICVPKRISRPPGICEPKRFTLRIDATMFRVVSLRVRYLS